MGGLTLDVKEVIKDALVYPFLDWKKILILGFILVVSNMASIIQTFLYNVSVVVITLGLVGFVVGFIPGGYKFKILKSSFNGVKEPPEFKNWSEMFNNGIKLFLIYLVYMMPAILLVFAIIPLKLVIKLIIGVRGSSSTFFSLLFGAKWFLGVTALLYFIVIIPLILAAMANMVHENSIRAAFNFHEIFHKISKNGWGNTLSWYLITEVIVLAILTAGKILIGISTLTIENLDPILSSLILIPYINMYLYRSVALLYTST